MRRLLLLSFVLCLLSFSVWSADTHIKIERFIDPEVCGDCHSEIYEQWQGSMHSKAFADPIWAKASKMFLTQVTKEGDKVEALYCVKCHTPAGFLSGEIKSTADDYNNASPIAAQGVFCDFCHSIKAVSGIGNGAFVVEPGFGEDEPGVKYGPFKDSKSDFHETAYSEIHTRAEFCGACHNVSHLSNHTPIENTYSEWRDSPYNTGDPKTSVVCQDCHMRQKPGVPATGKTDRPDNPGKACDDGPDRPHIWTHYFVGGNAVVTSLLGSKTHSQMAIERLQHAADIEILAPQKFSEEKLERFTIKVINSGAGHYLPTGLTMVRQMWLEVEITDKNGRVVYESGKVNEDGVVDPAAVMYHTVLGDENGYAVINVSLADRVLYDYRIPPKGYREEKTTFYVPEGAVSPLTISVKLNYRSASQELAKLLLGKDAPTIPIIEMVKATKSVKVAAKSD